MCCYKDEREHKDAAKMQENLKEYPAFIADYFDDLRSYSTRKAYFSYINGLLIWLLENKRVNKQSIADITPEDLDALRYNDIIKYLDSLLLEGAEVSSVLTKKNVLKAFWKYLANSDYVMKNIVDKIPVSKYKIEGDHEVKIPTETQIKNLITNAYNEINEHTRERNIAIIVLLAGTGMRAEELLGLDVDSIVEKSGEYYAVTKRKGDLKTFTDIWIRPEAMEIINAYIETRKNMQVETNALFVSSQNGRLSKTSLDYMLDKYSKGAIHPHLLRHVYATNMYKKTKDLVYVQKLLSHSSYDTTSKMYVSCKQEKDFFKCLCEVQKTL